MPPKPAGFTSDENEGDAPASLSFAWLTAVKRWLANLGLVVLVVALAYVFGYCRGRAAVTPAPGRAEQLARTIDSLRTVADSLRPAAEAARVAHAIAAPAADSLRRVVQVEAPGRLVVVAGSPRVVDVPLQVTASLTAERRARDAAEQWAAAEHARAEAERARADSAEVAVEVERRRRPSAVLRVLEGAGLVVLGLLIGRGTR
jgi:hypothetical protein